MNSIDAITELFPVGRIKLFFSATKSLFIFIYVGSKVTAKLWRRRKEEVSYLVWKSICKKQEGGAQTAVQASPCSLIYGEALFYTCGSTSEMCKIKLTFSFYIFFSSSTASEQTLNFVIFTFDVHRAAALFCSMCSQNGTIAALFTSWMQVVLL